MCQLGVRLEERKHTDGEKPQDWLQEREPTDRKHQQEVLKSRQRARLCILSLARGQYRQIVPFIVWAIGPDLLQAALRKPHTRALKKFAEACMGLEICDCVQAPTLARRDEYPHACPLYSLG